MWHLMEEGVTFQGGERSEIDIRTVQLQLCHLMHLLVHLLVCHPLRILSILDERIGVNVLFLRCSLLHQSLHQRWHDVVAHPRGHTICSATQLQLHHRGIEVMDEGGIVAVYAQTVLQILIVFDLSKREMECQQEADQCPLRHDVVFHQVAIQ